MGRLLGFEDGLQSHGCVLAGRTKGERRENEGMEACCGRGEIGKIVRRMCCSATGDLRSQRGVKAEAMFASEIFMEHWTGRS